MSKCVRCGKQVSGGGKGSRCKACLKKLSITRKTPGHPNHFQKLADDALARQDGKRTSAYKTKGRGSRKEIIAAMKAGYKKYGASTVLSPDRIDNSKGYTISNVRAVPKYLNVGRHEVDKKKMKKWIDRVKKSKLDADTLQKSIISDLYDRGMTDLAIAIDASNFIKKILK